jgi:VCBS repeat-containing protein
MNSNGSNQMRLTNNSLSDVKPSFGAQADADGDGSGDACDNTAPVANNDSYDTNEDATLNVSAPGVLGNDTDGENDTLTATLISAPANAASFTLNADGSFSYTPTANFNGSVSFTYKVSDGNLESNTATVTINVTSVNDAPTITAATGVTRQQAAGASNSSIAVVNDIEDAESALSVTVNGSSSATVNGVTVSGIAVSAVGNVTANIAAACGATGASFTLRVTDSGSLSAQTTLNVVVTLETTPPVINLSSVIFAPFPNNHRYATIQVSQLVASVSDNCSTLAVGNVVIEKVTSDEVDNAPGDSDGNTVNDIVIAANCRSVQLRAERDGNRNGRVYTITLRLRDAAGNTTRATRKISVPLSQNGSPAIEDAAAFTINGNCP